MRSSFLSARISTRESVTARAIILAALLLTLAAPASARAEALLLIEADSGKVLHAENAAHPWHPASVTKLMTAYVTLRAVKERRLSIDQLFTVSPVAMAQQPTKMGFKAGIQVTVDNAIKMMMVKSANDMSVVLAEGVSGSVEKFADEMNATASRLGMTQTHYVNPNGLPDDNQVTSARDQAILARAIIRDLPEYSLYFDLPAIKFGRHVMRNYNSLIGRYPGADGMKTGFICASGFNLVASATRNGKRLIAVVLGAPSSPVRAIKAAQLLERGFGGNGLSWLAPSLGSVEQLVPVNAAPPNLRDDMCGPKRKRPAAETLDEPDQAEGEANSASSIMALMSTNGANGSRKPSELLGPAVGALAPIVVYVGPKRTGVVQATADDEAAVAQPARKGKKAKKKGGGGKKLANAPQAGEDGKSTNKSTKKNAASAKQASAKPTAKPDAAKPASAKPSATKPKPAPKKPAAE